MKRPPTLRALLVALSLLLASCSTTAPGDSSKVVIRFGNIYPSSTTFGHAIDDMARHLELTSDGRISVDVFHSGTLGSEQSHIEAVREGSLEMAQTGTAGIGLFLPETALFELWYAFDDPHALVSTFDRLRPDLDRAFQQKGFKLLGAFYNGPRTILSTTPVHSLSDMRGLQLRVPESDLYVRMANALGARGISLPLGDAYTGLQTGTIDALEGSPDDLASGGYGEVAKYLTLDRHVYHPLSIVYNLDSWRALTQWQRNQISAAVERASRIQFAELARSNEEAIAGLKRDGVEVIPLSDRTAWKQRITRTSDEFAAGFGAEGKRITDTIDSATRTGDR